MRAAGWVLPVVLALGATVASSGPAPSGRPEPEVPGRGEPGGPDRELTGPELARWLRGRELFDRDLHRADGLGRPDYNGDSCRACHQDPAMGGAGGLGVNVTRHGFTDGTDGHFEELPGGQVLHKFRPPPGTGRAEHDPATSNVFEQRQTPTLLGAGRIDAIPESAILANEDPDDADGDGVRGVAHRLDVGEAVTVGRFGWKAQVPTVLDFVVDAMGIESGITCPDDGRGFALVADADDVDDPEMGPADLADLAFFLRHLAPPARTGSSDAAVLRGEELFASVGCAACHVPALPDDAGGEVLLYSDLLLHHVMPPGFRGVAQGEAGVGVYRTPPLWGVRHTAPYLHDGRAETLEEAIRGHAGEAAASVDRFLALSSADRASLVAFLRDL